MVPAVARTLLVIACATGCYAPTPAENVPCSASGECPEGQVCVPATQRCARILPEDGPDDAPADTPLIDVAPDAPTLAFADDFERADGAVIGNEWIEKTPLAFSLSGGEVVRAPIAGTSYRHHLVYRPPTEDLLDVEITIDVRVTAIPSGTPQVFVRAVSSSIATAPDAYTGYLLYGNSSQFTVGRQEGNVFVMTLSQFVLTEPLAVGSTYRMTLSAVGTAAVTLTARIDRLSVSGPVMIGQTGVVDGSAERLTVPGTVGFSGDTGTAYIYDRFRRTPL